MSTRSTPLTLSSRRAFVGAALGTVGGTLLACQGTEIAGDPTTPQVTLSLSGASTLFDRSGAAVQHERLLPSRPGARLRNGLALAPGDWRPEATTGRPSAAHRILAFRPGSAGLTRFRRDQRHTLADGTPITAAIEAFQGGVVASCRVMIPKGEGIELLAEHDYRQEGELAVYRGSRITAAVGGRLLAEVHLTATGTAVVAGARSAGLSRVMRDMAAWFTPTPAAAQSCLEAIIHFLAKTLAVSAIVASCLVSALCLLALAAGLVEWALAIETLEDSCGGELGEI